MRLERRCVERRCVLGVQPSQKTFKIKRVLAKKAKQNRPIPQWIRFRTNNKIRSGSAPFLVDTRAEPWLSQSQFLELSVCRQHLSLCTAWQWGLRSRTCLVGLVRLCPCTVRLGSSSISLSPD